MRTKKLKRKPARRGPKDSKRKSETDKKLTELFFQDGITPWRASIIANTGYEYARKIFSELGTKIVEDEQEDWIDRNEKVRKRTLEGLAIKLENCKTTITELKDHIVKYTEIQSDIQEIKGKDDHYDLNLYKNYGFLILSSYSTLHQEEIFAAELQQQYSAIEILPPPKAVLEVELEKRIAEKQNLAPAIPQEIKSNA